MHGHEKLVGVARDRQRQGIGKKLVARTKEAPGGGGIALVLLSASGGMEYYFGLRRF